MARRPNPFPTAKPFLPEAITLPQLRAAAEVCRGCDLYKTGTQTVFGEGPARASVMFVGEQPGDQEDLAGHPFVGPAGQVLDEAMAQAKIDRADVYVTNTVKHFKWEPRGKRRIHAKPDSREIEACLPWLKAEIATVKPKLIVCLGATAAQALLGRSFRVTRQRGEIVRDTLWAPGVTATYHPSAILRMPDEQMRAEARAALIADLRLVKKEMSRITQADADRLAARQEADVHAAYAAHH